MNGAEKGFLLLTSHLGDYRREVLTVSQFRVLAQRVAAADRDMENRHLTEADLTAIGYSSAWAGRIIGLLSDEKRLRIYMQNAADAGCFPLTRANASYPLLLRKRMELDSPGCLWVKGNMELLNKPAVSLVGSRELRPENKTFAEMAGRKIAEQGFVLVSGNARGADRVAQNACLAAGGSVICVVADNLSQHSYDPRILYISEEAYDAAFTAQRAHSRNRVIHSLGRGVLVVQSTLLKGGTWHGTMENLKKHYSPVKTFDDGSEAAHQLANHGCELITENDLADLNALFASDICLI